MQETTWGFRSLSDGPKRTRTAALISGLGQRLWGNAINNCTATNGTNNVAVVKNTNMRSITMTAATQQVLYLDLSQNLIARKSAQGLSSGRLTKRMLILTWGALRGKKVVSGCIRETTCPWWLILVTKRSSTHLLHIHLSLGGSKRKISLNSHSRCSSWSKSLLS